MRLQPGDTITRGRNFRRLLTVTSLLFVIYLVGWPGRCVKAADISTPLQLHVDYSIGQVNGSAETFIETSDRSWTIFDPDGAGVLPTGPHLNAMAIYVNDKVIGAVIDNPARRTIQAPTDGQNRESLYLRTLYLQAPWQANTAYVVGDKISGFTREIDSDNVTMPVYPNTTGYWTCTRAGTSGSMEPIWTPKLVLPANWADTYTRIASSPWVAGDYFSPTGDVHNVAHPWISASTLVSISTGFAVKVLRFDPPQDFYIWLSSGPAAAHGPQYVSSIYDPTAIYHRTVATKVLQDPDIAGVEWTYSEDTGAWIFEGPPTGAVVLKKSLNRKRYVDHGDTYSRSPQ